MKNPKKLLSTVMAGISAVSFCGIPTVSAYADEIISVPAVYSEAVSLSLKVGDKIKYCGDVYATSYGTGDPIQVNGTFKVSQILDDTSRKCRVQLENIGWVAINVISDTTPTPTPAVPENPSIPEKDIKVGSQIKYKGKLYVTSYGTGTPVEIDGTYTISQIISDTSRKCRVQLKGIGWITMEDARNSTLVNPPKEEEPTANEIKVGSKVKYSGNVYATSYGTGDPVKVNGTFTISQIISDTSRKCRVQFENVGWVSINDLTITSITPPAETNEIKVGSTVKYSGDVYATSFGKGNPVKVNGTYTISQILNDPSRKCPVQLKGVGWVSMEAITGTSTPVTPPPAETTEIKVGSTVKYSGNVYATSYGTGNPVKVNGTFTISMILSDTSRKCRVQLKGVGWVSMEELKGEAPKPVQPEIKVGDLVQYCGEVFYTCNGGKSAQVNGTYAVSAVIKDENVKYRIQLKGVGWISADNLVLS